MPAVRKATNVSLDDDLVREARALGLNVSRAAEAGLRDEVKRARAEAWNRENADALREWNEWVAQNGLPLEGHRPF